MSFLYGMIVGLGMDLWVLNVGNLFYLYGNFVMSFLNFIVGYG